MKILTHRNMGPVGPEADPLKCIYTDPDTDFFMKKIYTWIDASIYSFIPCITLLTLNVLIIRQVK